MTPEQHRREAAWRLALAELLRPAEHHQRAAARHMTLAAAHDRSTARAMDRAALEADAREGRGSTAEYAAWLREQARQLRGAP